MLRFSNVLSLLPVRTLRGFRVKEGPSVDFKMEEDLFPEVPSPPSAGKARGFQSFTSICRPVGRTTAGLSLSNSKEELDGTPGVPFLFGHLVRPLTQLSLSNRPSPLSPPPPLLLSTPPPLYLTPSLSPSLRLLGSGHAVQT